MNDRSSVQAHARSRMTAQSLMAIAFVVTGAGAVDFSPASQAVTLSEADNGRTVQVAPGAVIEVVLHSTYWQPKGASNAATLAPASQPRVQADLGGQCVPGAGCGTVTQTFTAVGSGQSEVTADRVVCGEAMACRPDQRHYGVTIVVKE